MSHQIVCPHCGELTEAQDTLACKAFSCDKCGKVIELD